MMDRLMEPNSKMFLSCLGLMGLESPNGKTVPLHLIAAKRLATYAKHVIELGQNIDRLDGQSRTSLHHAAKHGHDKVVEMPLKHGASNNIDDCGGLTPLHLGASSGHFKAVKKLLESGIDALTPKTKENPGNWCSNAPRATGETPVEYARSYGHTKTVLELLRYLNAEGLSKALCWAAGYGKAETALAILENSPVDMNCMVDDRTLIHMAVHAYDLPVMEKLLRMGADARSSVSVFSANKEFDV